MKAVVQDFLDVRNPQSLQEYDRTLRELIQHLVLLGLWRAGFFEQAAFYGGTALRILHHLPRFFRAASDVLPFIHDPRELDLWSAAFFSALRERILIC